ncbi:MAG: thioredoxin family protein [Christensenellaceae bacterium]|jgi:thioredoxin 1|nr:thioredoxin family protein [Christensenellaceae bacterium]
MKEINENEFDEKTANGISVVDFWGVGCGACRMIQPVLEQIEKEKKGINFWSIDTGSSEGLNRRFGITHIPFIVIMKDGEVIEKWAGLKPKAVILKMLENL